MLKDIYCLLALTILCSISSAQQISDLKYNPPIAKPAYQTGKGPRVAIDEAHHNFHTADGRYKPFAEFLRRDGYRVEGFSKSFTNDSLKGIDVLVIANALHERNKSDWSLPTPSALTKDEIATAHKWVTEGGSLFLIVDHMPFPGAAGELAKAFGIEFSNGYAKPGNRDAGVTADIFDLKNGLKESMITTGRSGDPEVTSIATFTGSAFKLPKDATAVLMFGKNSVSLETTKAPGISADAPKIAIEGWSQGAVMKVGKGRIAIFGEAAMFSAQLAGAKQRAMGMNAPEAKQNHQLLLNIMHWLTKASGMPE